MKPSQAGCQVTVRETRPSRVLCSPPTPSSLSPSQTTPLGSQLPGLALSATPICLQESTQLTHSHIHANKDPCTYPCHIHTLANVHLSTDAQALTSHVQASMFTCTCVYKWVCMCKCLGSDTHIALPNSHQKEITNKMS